MKFSILLGDGEALVTITIPIIASWRTGGHSSIPNVVYCVHGKSAAYDCQIKSEPSVKVCVRSDRKLSIKVAGSNLDFHDPSHLLTYASLA